MENPEQAKSIPRAPKREQLKLCESAPFQCLTLMDGAAMVRWDNGKAEHCQSNWAGSSRKELPSVHGVNRGGEGSSRDSVHSLGHQEKAVSSPCDLGGVLEDPKEQVQWVLACEDEWFGKDSWLSLHQL